MPWEAWAMLVVMVLMIVALAKGFTGPDVVMLGTLTVMLVLGLFSDRLPNVNTVVGSFGNPGLVTVAVLFVVAAGLTATGAMERLTAPLLGRPKSMIEAQARLTLPIAVMSALLNNTPIVAMFLPVVNDWCRRAKLSPSKLFMPLSYAAILGGMCTLIGTSTNLVVNGMLLDDPDTRGMGLFEIGAVGLPCAVVGIAYILITGRWLLPDRKPAIDTSGDPREYTVEMTVDAGGPLIGQTIEQAGLRHLPGLYLAEIERDGGVLHAVAPTEKLKSGDRLVFAGVLESVVDLRKMRGLSPATKQVFKLDAPQTHRCLIEAVVSSSCPVVGKTIRDGRFRSVYGAAVIAVARDGQRVNKKIGDIVLRAGDTLLLETEPQFVGRRRNSRDFYLVSQVAGSTAPRHERAPIAMLILLGMMIAVTGGWVSMLLGAMIAGGLMWLTRCTTGTNARDSIDWQVLVIIGAALGVGQMVEASGLATGVAHGMLNVLGTNPWLALLGVYIITNVFTELMTNNAAAVLVFPIAKATAMTLGVDFMPFAATIMIAASAGFATPIGYQTNLMVYGPGGYKFTDYTRYGLPLNFLILTITVILAPIVWPF